MTKLSRSAITLTLVLCACGSGAPSSNNNAAATVNGTLGGSAMTAREALSANGPLLGPGSATGTGILISDVSGTCSLISSNARAKNGRSLGFFLLDAGADGGSYSTSAGVGTYPVYNLADPNYPSAGKVAFGSFDIYDASCMSTGSGFVTGGNVVVTASDASGITGTFDVRTKTGDHVTGSFRTSVCGQLLAIGGEDAGAPGCR